jgi:hypothetical protein
MRALFPVSVQLERLEVTARDALLSHWTIGFEPLRAVHRYFPPRVLVHPPDLSFTKYRNQVKRWRQFCVSAPLCRSTRLRDYHSSRMRDSDIRRPCTDARRPTKHEGALQGSSRRNMYPRAIVVVDSGPDVAFRERGRKR